MTGTYWIPLYDNVHPSQWPPLDIPVKGSQPPNFEVNHRCGSGEYFRLLVFARRIGSMVKELYGKDHGEDSHSRNKSESGLCELLTSP